MSEWPVRPLGDVVLVNPREARPAPDAPFIPMESVTPGERWAAATQEVGTRSGARFRGGDVLFARITPCLENGKTAQAPLDLGLAGGSTEFIVLRATDEVDATYLYCLATSPDLRARAAGLMTGSTGRQRLSAKDLAALDVPVPPLDEQRAIGRLITATDDVIAGHRRAIAAATHLTEAVREDLLAESETVPLSDLLEAIQGGRSPMAEDRSPEPGERAVLKVSAIKPSLFVPTESKTLAPATHMPAQARVALGDVLITRANTAQLVGAVCRVTQLDRELYLSDKTLRLVPNESQVLPDYLVHALAARQVREQLSNAATGTSATMKNVSQAKLRDVRVPLLPLDRQQAVVRVLNGLVARTRLLEEAKDTARRTRSALVQGLLAQHYNVSNGPSNEEDAMLVSGAA